MIVAPSFKIGGIQRELSTLANEFVKADIQVTYLSLLNSDRHFELDERVNVIVPSGKRGKSLISKIIYRMFLPLFIRENIKKFRPQVVYSSADTFNPIVILASLRTGVKVVVKDVTKPDRHFAWFTRVGKKYLYPKADGFIAQTNSAARFYANMFNNRLNTTVIGSMIEHISDVPVTNREKIILQVGRVSIEKGQDRIIEIFNLVKKKEDWKLYITSFGPLLETVKNKVKELGLEDSVEFVGFVDDLSELYSKAAIFVIPSRMEGFPNALIEAMSHGTPSVVFDTFPADEIIEQGKTGFIVSDGDYQGFANSLQQLMQDESLRMQIGEEGKSVNQRFSVQELSKATEEFLFNDHKCSNQS